MRRFFSTVVVLTCAVCTGSPAQGQIALVPGPPSLVAAAPWFIATADFNKDKFADVVVTNSRSNKITVLLGQDGPSFGAILDLHVGRALRGIYAGDLDNDGNPDIAVVDLLDGRAFVVAGNGDGTFKQPVSYAGGRRPRDVSIGNFDNQKGNDLVTVDVAFNNATVLLNKGQPKGGFNFMGAFAVGKTPKRCAAADLNGDGFDDIIAVNTASAAADDVSVLLNTTKGGFHQPPANFVVGAGAKDLAIADFNNDGVPDIAVLNALKNAQSDSYSVSILLNQTTMVNGQAVGTGFFTAAAPVQLGCPLTVGGLAIRCVPNFLAAGDFDNDGFADFAVSFYARRRGGDTIDTAGIVMAFQGHGDGTFDLSTQVSVGRDPQGIVAGDFDGDGVTDLAVAERGSRSVRILHAVAPPRE